MVPVDNTRAPEAVQFMESIGPRQRAIAERRGSSNICLIGHVSFQVVDPTTGSVLPGQDPMRYGGIEYEGPVPLGASTARLIIGERVRFGIELCLPDLDGDDLQSVVSGLQRHLPFKFSDKHWRRWTRTASGSFQARTIASPLK